MPVAEIIAIGTELLLGEIQDTNTRYLALALRNAGIDLYRTMTVGDNVHRIAQVVQESLERVDIIITTGGLGPTVDDPTRQAVAEAVGVELDFQPVLWDQIQERFKRYNRPPTENNKRQAYIPQGALPIENPVGTAPAFIVETSQQAIISLPGVPREMEFLVQKTVLPYLRSRYNLKGLIKTRVLHTVSVGESMVDELIGDLEVLGNPTVGLLAHPGQIDIRIAAKSESERAADQMIDQVAQVIRERLGSIIYGEDDQTLEAVALAGLAGKNWSLVTVECGLNGGLLQRLSRANGPYAGWETLAETINPEAIKEQTLDFQQKRHTQVALGVGLYPLQEKMELYIFLATPDGMQEITRSYGGPPQNAPLWAVSNSIDLIRRTVNGLEKG